MKYVMIGAVIGFFAMAQYWGLFHTPADRQMGDVQRLMYVHVPAAWNSFIAFFLVFCSSIAFLIRRSPFWDRLAASCAEVGVVLTALTLALGSIWGKPTWGVWWTWDARLTTTAILLFLYIGYLTMRAFIEDPGTRARVAAPIGILIFLNVPVVYFSVKWWRTLHQVQSSPATVDPAMVLSLRLNALAFFSVLILFIYYRYRLRCAQEARDELLNCPPDIIWQTEEAV